MKMMCYGLHSHQIATQHTPMADFGECSPNFSCILLLILILWNNGVVPLRRLPDDQWTSDAALEACDGKRLCTIFLLSKIAHFAMIQKRK